MIDNGLDSLFTAVTDRQNSLTAVMANAGKKVERFAYDPWGLLRNPADWTVNVVKGRPTRFGRGYCMHEHIHEFGLIDMGGRIYDAHTHQFLTPDPYMQAPDSWLSHNRYAYCMQNPVMYTDPNGEIAWFAPIIIGAVIGGGMNLGIKAWNGEINNFADGMKAFCVGAGAGAVAGMASYAMGPAIAGTGFMGGFASGVISSFLGNSVLSIGNSDAFGDPMMSGTQMLYSSLFSGFFGGVANGILAKMAGRNFWSGKTVAQDVATTAKPVPVEESKKPTTTSKTTPTVTEENYTIKFNESNSVPRSFSPENTSFDVEIPRPNITGYEASSLKLDASHQFPMLLDDIIVKSGQGSLTSQGNYWFVAQGTMNRGNGWYSIGIRPNGSVFHRCFSNYYPYAK